MMKNDELIEQVNTIIDCINSGGTLPIHSSAILMNMVLKFKQYSEAEWINVYQHADGNLVVGPLYPTEHEAVEAKAINYFASAYLYTAQLTHQPQPDSEG